MRFEDIFNEWEKDSQMDNTELGSESLRIPVLHHKYFKIMTAEAMMLRQYERELKTLTRKKYEYYTGTLSEEELRENDWEPQQLRILKADIPMYMDSDQDIQTLQHKIDNQKQKLNFLESAIKTIVNRGFLIKNAIDWERFKNGG